MRPRMPEPRMFMTLVTRRPRPMPLPKRASRPSSARWCGLWLAAGSLLRAPVCAGRWPKPSQHKAEMQVQLHGAGTVHLCRWCCQDGQRRLILWTRIVQRRSWMPQSHSTLLTPSRPPGDALWRSNVRSLLMKVRSVQHRTPGKNQRWRMCKRQTGRSSSPMRNCGNASQIVGWGCRHGALTGPRSSSWCGRWAARIHCCRQTLAGRWSALAAALALTLAAKCPSRICHGVVKPRHSNKGKFAEMLCKTSVRRT
mmetsp:Transcript_78331/g.181730  ORF Transcript_78331/g.181730 Transcript_78331/m.181730 type:complete len:254 (+) Transcript_78331:156-917(+)